MLSFLYFYKKVYKNLNFLSVSSIIYPYSSPSTVDISLFSSRPIYKGYFNDNFARFSICFVIVAENKAVYRFSFGRILSISFSSSSKPIFIIASASSIINVFKFENIKLEVFYK